MAVHRHKRETKARRLARRMPRAVTVAGPFAFVATASAVTLGVLAGGAASTGSVMADDTTAGSSAPDAPTAAASAAVSDAAAADVSARAGSLSRSERRSGTLTKQVPSKAASVLDKTSTRQAVQAADTRLWASDDLNLWDEPGKRADQVGEVEAGTRILVTGRELYGREEVVVDGISRWVTNGYLSDEKPLGLGAGLSDAPCPDGSVESGLTSAAVLVYRSVCNAFPQITSYGGWDAHGEHSSGKAIDIMTSDVELGTAIAEFLQSHAAELGLYDVIWRQHIWTPVRASEGWRSMPSRGSATADHYDHVHVAVN